MTSIEWTRGDDGSKGETWNPVVGCSIKSAGCTNCYAMGIAHRGMSKQHRGLTVMTSRGAKWNGEVRFLPDVLAKPLSWRKPRRVFVNSMSDLFHEGLAFEQIAAVFGVMAACPQHTFQVLTKRPERAREFFAWLGAEQHRYEGGQATACVVAAQQATDYETLVPAPIYSRAWPLPNVWIGVSCEDQRAADERIPILLELPAVVRFVSAEPLLGPIDFRAIPYRGDVDYFLDAIAGRYSTIPGGQGNTFAHGMALKRPIDWIIVGGESGPGARPCDVAWIRSIVEQCAGAGVPVFCKQLGAKPINGERSAIHDAHGVAAPSLPHEEVDRLAPNYVDGHVVRPAPVRLRDRKGADMAEWPEDLRVRAFPEVRRAL